MELVREAIEHSGILGADRIEHRLLIEDTTHYEIALLLKAGDLVC